MLYKCKGTCSQAIELELDGTKIQNVKFIGGCDGNTKGICNLVKGMEAQDILSRLEGTTCGYKSTSCPDQLAKALKAALS